MMNKMMVPFLIRLFVLHNDSDNYYSKDQKPIIVSRNNGNNPNGIHVFGSLKIDSVKITSWNPEKNKLLRLI